MGLLLINGSDFEPLQEIRTRLEGLDGDFLAKNPHRFTSYCNDRTKLRKNKKIDTIKDHFLSNNEKRSIGKDPTKKLSLFVKLVR